MASTEVASKMREAHEALKVARDLHDEAMAMIGYPYTASGAGFRDLIEDLDIDISRAESGGLGDD